MDINQIIDEKYKKIAQVVEEHGGRMYLVGGAVRDILLRKNAS